MNFKHGLKGSRFYAIWANMLSRCKNKNVMAYKNYGGRGIKILWIDFQGFKEDMYESYVKHCQEFGINNTTIDRIDNNGHYCKNNCRWSTQKEQSENRRSNRMLRYNGKTQTMIGWAKEVGINWRTIQKRLNRGWSTENTLTKEISHLHLKYR